MAYFNQLKDEIVKIAGVASREELVSLGPAYEEFLNMLDERRQVSERRIRKIENGRSPLLNNIEELNVAEHKKLLDEFKKIHADNSC